MIRFLAFTFSLLSVSSALAHHSDAGLDMDSLVTIDGVVSEFAWRNPHVYIGVETTGENGELVEWAIQTNSTILSARMGWSRDSLTVGERVTGAQHHVEDQLPERRNGYPGHAWRCFG